MMPGKADLTLTTEDYSDYYILPSRHFVQADFSN